MLMVESSQHCHLYTAKVNERVHIWLYLYMCIYMFICGQRVCKPFSQKKIRNT